MPAMTEATDPRDDFLLKPKRPHDRQVSGEGAAPAVIEGWDDPAVVYRELFFDGLPTEEYPRGWWTANLWLKQA